MNQSKSQWNYNKVWSFSVEKCQCSRVISEDGSLLVTGGFDDVMIHVWDLKSLSLRYSWQAHPLSPLRSENRVICLSMNAESSLLVSGGALIQSWDLTTGNHIRDLRKTGFALTSVMSRDGQFLVTYDGEAIVVWNLSKNKRVRKSYLLQIYNMAISSDNEELIGWDDFRSSVKAWDLIKGTTIRTFEKSNLVKRVYLSLDNQILAGSGPAGIQFWNYKTGEKLKSIGKIGYNKEFFNHLDRTFTCAFSKDGKTIFSSGGDWKIQIWDVETTEHVGTISGENPMLDCLMSADSSTLVTFFNDYKTFEVWMRSSD
jgi:WD40 repeat protein